MDPVAGYLLRLVVTLTVLVLAVEMIGLFVLAVRRFAEGHHRHTATPHPTYA